MFKAFPLKIKIIALVCFLGVLGTQSAYAFTAFNIAKINVVGNKNTPKDLVLSLLPTKKGALFDKNASDKTVRAVYKSGFFKTVELKRAGNVLEIHVVERPLISEIKFVGISKKQKKALEEGLRNAGFIKGGAFNPSTLHQIEHEVKQQYLFLGLYASKVRADVTPEKNNRVHITITVRSQKVAKIKQISILGNKAYSSGVLLSLLSSAPTNMLSWYTSDDRFSAPKLKSDIAKIRSYYHDRGYAKMTVDSVLTSINTDLDAFVITANISEGSVYRLGNVSLKGNTVGLSKPLHQEVTIKKGDVYSERSINRIQTNIKNILAIGGYAFAEVKKTLKVDDKRKTVDVTLQVIPRFRAYIRRITIRGNTKTRDYVIRRKLTLNESSWFNRKDVLRSQARVMRLGYFSQVRVMPQAVPGAPTLVDINVLVVEKSSDTASLGGGYSAEGGLSLQLSVNQANFLGTGTTNSLIVNMSSNIQNYSLSFSDPYYTKYGVSRSFSIDYNKKSPKEDGSYEYTLKTLSAGVNFGIPYNEFSTVFLGLSLDQTSLDTGENSPDAYIAYVKQFTSKDSVTNVALPLLLSWQRDSRDSLLYSRSGTFQYFYNKISFLTDLKYYKLGYNAKVFVPLNNFFNAYAKFKTDLGFAVGTRPYPIFSNFYLGGINNLRGYSYGSIEAQDAEEGDDNFGAPFRSYFSFGITAPFPWSDLSSSLRWQAFFDGGMLAKKYQNTFKKLKYSYGIMVGFRSPVGMLKFSFAEPIDPEKGDSLEGFQFTIGGEL